MPQSPSPSSLAPCPHCGSPNVERHHMACECADCGARAPDDLTWNRRAALSAVEALGQQQAEPVASPEDGGGCTLAGPGRGDCEHFVGLPGRSIPGQHDGPDDTVDCYGKPNGWCWSCWKSRRIAELEARLASPAALQQQEAGSGWRTIESAPKEKDAPLLLTNGKDVSQGWWCDEPGYIREHRDLDGRYIDQDESDGFMGWMDCDGGMQPEPTHWQPLPLAPGVNLPDGAQQ